MHNSSSRNVKAIVREAVRSKKTTHGAEVTPVESWVMFVFKWSTVLSLPLDVRYVAMVDCLDVMTMLSEAERQ